MSGRIPRSPTKQRNQLAYEGEQMRARPAAVVSERLKRPGDRKELRVLIEFDENGMFVILYEYAEDRPRPDPTPSQYCRRP